MKRIAADASLRRDDDDDDVENEASGWSGKNIAGLVLLILGGLGVLATVIWDVTAAAGWWARRLVFALCIIAAGTVGVVGALLFAAPHGRPLPE
jgi:hypothetical protein